MKEKELERLTKLKEIEKELYNKGFKNICGIDEAGRGPLARSEEHTSELQSPR